MARRKAKWKIEDYLKWGLIAYVFIQVIMPTLLLGSGVLSLIGLTTRRLPSGPTQPPYTNA